VLKVLYRSYFGRVKMIYIDPPYNTGNDFIYPDNFADPLDHYLRITGQKNGDGDYTTSQVDKNGRIHSAWLSMMYPRLALARQFLSDDGILCVSISDHELPNLRLLLDQVFGEELFVAQFIWKSRKFPDSRSTKQVSVDHEYLVTYRRSSEGLFRGVERDETKFQNPDNDPRGPWMSRSMLGLATAEQRPNLHFKITDPKTKIDYPPPRERGWRYGPARMAKLIESGCVLFPADPDGRPREKKFMADLQNEFMAIPTIVDDVHTSDGTDEIREIFGFQAFDFPKPSELIRRLVEQLSGDGDIVLDFFSGSGPTAQAVLEQNHRDGRQRKYLCVQLPERLSPESEAAKRGFANIAEIAKYRIKAVIKKYATVNGNGNSVDVRIFKLAPSNIRNWTGVDEKDADILATQIEAFADSLVSGWKSENVIWEVALREGYSLTARVEKIPDVGKQNFWRVTDPDREQSFVICLDDTLTLDAVRALKLTRNALFVCRDTALDDTLSANLALQCRLKVL
jgi:adenine-specific DNA-methyltransferase